MIKSIPCLRQKSRKTYLAGRTSPLSPYKGVPPPPRVSAAVGGRFMIHGHGLLTRYLKTTVSSKADHPLFVWQLLSVLKSERRSFVLNSRNTDEHYDGYNLLKNTDLSLNDTNRFIVLSLLYHVILRHMVIACPV